jgi:predicted RNase H-like HicB family nuclease
MGDNRLAGLTAPWGGKALNCNSISVLCASGRLGHRQPSFASGPNQHDNSLFLVRSPAVKTYSAVIERDSETGLFVGFVPGFPGAHSQGSTLDELNANLREVISMLLEDGDPVLESEFVGVQNVAIA